MHMHFRSRRQARKVHKQQLLQATHEENQQLQQEVIEECTDSGYHFMNLSNELQACQTVDESVAIAENSPAFQKASPEVKQAIIHQIFSRFSNDSITLSLFKRFKERVDQAKHREAALKLKETPDYLNASQPLAQMMDQYIDQSFPPQAGLWTRWQKRLERWQLLISVPSFILTILAFVGIENYRALIEKYPNLGYQLFLSVIAWITWRKISQFVQEGSSDSSTDTKRGSE